MHAETTLRASKAIASDSLWQMEGTVSEAGPRGIMSRPYQGGL